MTGLVIVRLRRIGGSGMPCGHRVTDNLVCSEWRRSALSLRNPGLNQVPLHARQQDLAVVQRQAERIEGRMGGGAATSGTPTGQGRAPREAEGRSLAVADGDAAAFSLVTLLPFSSFRTSGFSSDH